MKHDLFAVFGLAYVALVIVSVAGWVSNIINVIGFIGTEFVAWTGLQILEIVGIFVPPLGAILGVISWF